MGGMEGRMATHRADTYRLWDKGTSGAPDSPVIIEFSADMVGSKKIIRILPDNIRCLTE